MSTIIIDHYIVTNVLLDGLYNFIYIYMDSIVRYNVMKKSLLISFKYLNI